MSNLVVQTNVLALNSHRNLKVIGGKQSVASARLSSGYRINSAADDASGLAISEKMRAQIRGLDMASKNTQDGISLVQTAEGGMQEIDNMIQRIRELTVQASNDTNDYDSLDRKKVQDEIDQLTQGIDKMAEQVEFNNKKLLDGSLLDSTSKAELIGAANQDMLDLIGTTQTAGAVLTLVITSTGFTNGVASITAASNGTNTIPGVASVGVLSSACLTSYSAAKEYIDLLDTFIQGASAHAASGDTAAEALVTEAKATRDAVLGGVALMQQAEAKQLSREAIAAGPEGEGLWFQTGANSMQGINVSIGSIKTDVLGIGDGIGGSKIKVNNASGEQISSFVNRVNDALQYVSAERARLGAVQNRMEYTKSSLDISSENLSAAESRIRDADMAKEMMKMTAANVLQQAGVSMLSQANQAPQSVLQLLG